MSQKIGTLHPIDFRVTGTPKSKSAYATVTAKFIYALIFAISWMALSVWISAPWYDSLGAEIGVVPAGFLITFIAIVPGFINAFVFVSTILDKRPQIGNIAKYPPATVLVAAYNEETSIGETVESLFNQNYPGELKVIVINDGSSDKTAWIVRTLTRKYENLELIDLEKNAGKANALNQGLKACLTDIVITVDADCTAHVDAIKTIVGRYLTDPETTTAVAGSIMVKNPKQSWITKAQEWDYFLGISITKRIQSMFQGTLVAQGAFSLYDRRTLVELGGWPEMVGEDIVLTWKMLDAGYRVGHAENAYVYTTTPSTLKQFARQRRRWSRGLMEAFKANPRILFRPRLTMMFIWWNTLYPLMDIAFTFGYIPGMILALFGKFWIVGPMTLCILPLTILMNSVMYQRCKSSLEEKQLTTPTDKLGLLIYSVAYPMFLQPACVVGYFSELMNMKKTWGTK